jgi:hypothetical protein
LAAGAAEQAVIWAEAAKEDQGDDGKDDKFVQSIVVIIVVDLF